MTAAIRDTVSADLRTTLRALRLGQMPDTLPDRLTLGRQQKMTRADFLELVLAGEHARREARSAGLRARAAGLDPAMRLDTRDETAAVRDDRQLRNELVSLRFPDGPHGALLLGPAGAGKTHLACAGTHRDPAPPQRPHGPGQHAVQEAQGRPARQHPGRRDPQAHRHRLADPGPIRGPQPLDATKTADFYQLCVERHQRASTIVTSHRTGEEWLSMMADPLLAQSAVDRLVSTAHELIIEGESCRRRQKPALHGPDRSAPVNHDSEYRYTPRQIPGPGTEHPGCFLTACRRLWCTRPVHVALISRGQPRRYCSPAGRVAEHRRLRG